MYKYKINITKLYIRCKKHLPIIIYTSVFILICVVYIIINSANKHNIQFILLFFLIYSEIILITIINFILFYKIKSILKRRTNKKKKFHRQIIVLFSVAAIIPTLFVFVFAVVFFNIGIESLFKQPIKDVIDSNNAVIENYLQDIHLVLRSYTNNLTSTIGKYIANNNIDVQEIEKILAIESNNNKIDAIVFQISDNSINIIAKSVFSLSIQYMLPNPKLILPVDNIISYETNNYVVSLSKIDEHSNIFLAVVSPIDQNIVDYREKIKQASNKYVVLLQKHLGFKITFLMLFLIITLLLLLLSIFSGLVMANKILVPINKLITATNKISCGNYITLFEVNKIHNEWDELLLTFNNMVSQLEHQKQQLTVYSKQTAWRDLARKIAHEVKNPLTPILLSAERIKNKYKKEIVTSPEIFDLCINTIIRQVNCISCLIKEFSDFARMPAPVMGNNDIVKLLQEVIFLQSSSNPDIEIKSVLDCSELIFKFDAVQINQVLINTIQNAINSIRESSSGSHSSSNKKNNDALQSIGTILIHCYLKNNCVFIVIEDSGSGFSETALQKAFEPYFTTRKSGNGLGLAIVYKIINDHGGEISIGNSSTLGGAQVSINIPYVK